MNIIHSETIENTAEPTIQCHSEIIENTGDI